MFKSKFKFNTDQLLQKAETADYFEIEGLASTDDRDLQDEIVRQNFDLTAIEAGKGYLNDDHGQKYKVGEDSQGRAIINPDLARIGVIDEARIKPEGLWIKGKVWKNHPASTAYYNEMKHKPGMVQFSVEGYSVKRDPRNKGTVSKAYLTGVALTRNPVNPYTYAKLAKSLSGQETEVEPADLVKSQAVSVIRDENDFVTGIEVKEILNPNHPDFIEYYAEIIEKGGSGSGRKPTGVQKPHEEAREKHEHAQAAPKDAKEGDVRNRPDKSGQRVEELKHEKQLARDSAKSPEEAKKNLAEVKERHAASAKKKRVAVKQVVVKKSEIFEELMERAAANPEFKKSLEAMMEKALTTGGPAYATTLPGDMTGGQVFQTEELEADKKKKKNDEKQ